MIKMVKRLIQRPVKAKTKTDYIRLKLEQGHKVSQLGLYKMTEREGVPEMFTTRLGSAVFRLRQQGLNVKSNTVKKGKVQYAEYYI